MSKSKSQWVVVRDGFIRSLIADAITFGALIGLMFLNFKYWEGHWYTTIFILLIWLVAIMAKGEKDIHRFNSKEEAIKYIESLKK